MIRDGKHLTTPMIRFRASPGSTAHQAVREALVIASTEGVAVEVIHNELSYVATPNALDSVIDGIVMATRRNRGPTT